MHPSPLDNLIALSYFSSLPIPYFSNSFFNLGLGHDFLLIHLANPSCYARLKTDDQPP